MSHRESDAGNPAAEKPAAEKSAPNIVRMVLLVLLVIIVAVAFFELGSRRQAKAAYDRIDAALGDNEPIDQSEIQEWLGRKPDTTSTVNDVTKTFSERYEFAGPLRKRTLRVDYVKRAATLVQGVALE